MKRQHGAIQSGPRRAPLRIAMALVIGVGWITAAAWTAQEPAAPDEERPKAGYAAGEVGEASFHIDPETGSIIVLADDVTNQYIQQVLENLDRPVPQVLIKVLFLEVTHGNDLDLGTEFSLRYGGKKVGVDNDGDGVVDEKVAQFEDTLETIFGLTALYEAGVDGGYYRIMKEDLDITIRALAEVGKLEVLSRPSILARNNETAIITLGQEVPFITNSRVTQDGQIINTVEYEDVGIILEVTPHISPEGLVEMLVMPEISTLSGETVTVTQGVEVPIIAKRAAETSIVVPDGMTVVIGGLMEDNETDLNRKIPILGDIPWAGSLFRRTVKSKSKTELLIFLTPHVVRHTPELQAMASAESKKAQLTTVAFTEKELDQHLDNRDKLVAAPPPPAERPGWWERTKTWMWSAVQILR